MFSLPDGPRPAVVEGELGGHEPAVEPVPEGKDDRHRRREEGEVHSAPAPARGIRGTLARSEIFGNLTAPALV